MQKNKIQHMMNTQVVTRQRSKLIGCTLTTFQSVMRHYQPITKVTIYRNTLSQHSRTT